MEIKFSVFGTPQPKQRPRAAMINGYARIYTPKTTREFEQAVAYAFRQAGGVNFGDRLVSVEISVYMPLPSNFSKPKIKAGLEGVLCPTGGGDCDNLAKSILDGLNKIAYTDDKQVVDLTVHKRYAQTAETVVCISDSGFPDYNEWKAGQKKKSER